MVWPNLTLDLDLLHPLAFLQCVTRVDGNAHRCNAIHPHKFEVRHIP